ncbi:uncharacterized protein LOC126884977 [Diabrotica virgifera virgifera]|uniref:BPTI/Kunitz inhibitor domain-containing protein n=1 Tax=Diabrotica virgifera virgifera TaxID=50390 RepID=A0ABM5KAV5_DIAVI|nr:uncharacterized protein LOC126884977 [Diabrotica virgifera virgifera]
MKIMFFLFSVVFVSAVLPLIKGNVVLKDDGFLPEDCKLFHMTTNCHHNGTSSAIDVWRFDVKANDCIEDLFYTSCEATKNNFKSFEKCVSVTYTHCIILRSHDASA